MKRRSPSDHAGRILKRARRPVASDRLRVVQRRRPENRDTSEWARSGRLVRTRAGRTGRACRSSDQPRGDRREGRYCLLDCLAPRRNDPERFTRGWCPKDPRRGSEWPRCYSCVRSQSFLDVHSGRLANGCLVGVANPKTTRKTRCGCRSRRTSSSDGDRSSVRAQLRVGRQCVHSCRELRGEQPSAAGPRSCYH
jgi:hypothetical protein